MVIILTGPVHSGKTSLLKKAVFELKDQKVIIEGFLSEVVLENKEIVGYDLFDLKEERSIPFIRKEGEEEWQKVGLFFFIPQSLVKAKEIILRSRNADILVVDEVGPLELAGKGLWPSLKQVLFQPLTPCFLVVRENILENISKILSGCEVKVLNIKNKKVYPQIIEEMKGAVSIR